MISLVTVLSCLPVFSIGGVAFKILALLLGTTAMDSRNWLIGPGKPLIRMNRIINNRDKE